MSGWGISEGAAAVHEAALLWDSHSGFSPRADMDLAVLGRWRAAGTSFLSLNVGYDHVVKWQDTLRNIAHFRRWLAERPDEYALVDAVDDIASAKQAGKLAIAFDIEAAEALDGNIEMIGLYRRLGVRQMLLAYNRDNAFAGGCHDGDRGLTPLGREAVKEMNRVGITVDCSHTSHRSTMEIMEITDKPVVFSHSNPRALCDHGRNIHDDQVDACARTGGVIGINGVGLFLGGNEISTAAMVRHIDYVAERNGPDHVGIGLDYAPDDEDMEALFKAHPEAWPGYTPDMMGKNQFAAPEQLPELTEQLLQRGYSEAEVRGILGGNFMRVAAQTWQ